MMADYNFKHVSVTILVCLQFLTHHFIIPVAGDPPPYSLTDNIVIDCGVSGYSTVIGDPRTWLGDVDSKFFPSNLQNNSASVTSRAETQSSSANDVYVTARLSRSQFTYLFPVTPGQKFIRLYFYPAPYLNFDRSNAVFSVSAGGYTLLRDFSASLNADASGSVTIFKEYCMYVEGNDQRLNITFTPSNQDTYAFINGIEIVSMPINLYHTPPQANDRGGRGWRVIGQNNKFFPIENYTTLEMLYRVNNGGNTISATEDTGMFRSWSQDIYKENYSVDARPLNRTITLNFSQIPNYTAPADVYRTAQTMGPNAIINKSNNITWKFLVDPQFFYMLRLHFCEFEGPVNDRNDRVFLIYIRDMIVEEAADVIKWAGGKGIPIYKNYVVFVPGEKKVDLSVILQANPQDWKTRYSNVILNGIEIFKLNDSNSNLAGKNPDPPPTTTQSLPLPPSTTQSKSSRGRRTAIVISAVVGGVVFCLIATLVLYFFVSQRGKKYKDHTSNEGTSRRAPFSFSTIKSSKTKRSNNLPADVCRYFSLAEIEAATKDFDDLFNPAR